MHPIPSWPNKAEVFLQLEDSQELSVVLYSCPLGSISWWEMCPFWPRLGSSPSLHWEVVLLPPSAGSYSEWLHSGFRKAPLYLLISPLCSEASPETQPGLWSSEVSWLLLYGAQLKDRRSRMRTSLWISLFQKISTSGVWLLPNITKPFGHPN